MSEATARIEALEAITPAQTIRNGWFTGVDGEGLRCTRCDQPMSGEHLLRIETADGRATVDPWCLPCVCCLLEETGS